MAEFSKGSMVGKAMAFFRRVSGLKIGTYAASACYFIALSIFPALLLVLSLLRYTGLGVEYLTDLLEGFLPGALMPAVNQLVISTYRNASGTLASLSALVALWSASRGVHGILQALNVIYGVRDDRSWLHNRGLSVLYTFGFLVVLLLTLLMSVFGNVIIRYLPDYGLWRLLDGVVDLRFFLLLLLQTGLFTAIYTVFPNHKRPCREALPGAFMAALGWTGFSRLFSLYVTYFPNYANIYGSVYAVALIMLWMYVCISIVFYGGVLNCYLAKKEK